MEILFKDITLMPEQQAKIEIAREKTGNFCIFAYSLLFDSSDDHELARQNEEQRALRQARRTPNTLT